MNFLKSAAGKRPGSLLLLSGLPLGGNSSFLRQLSSLATVWRQRGWRIFLGGPVFPDVVAGLGIHRVHAEPLWCLQGCEQRPWRFEDLVSHTTAAAVIALGYLDQFPFLEENSHSGIPIFLWAQFSRVPRKAFVDWPLYVPLTAKTATLLHRAGCPSIGPIIPHGVDTHLFTPRLPSHCLVPHCVVGTVGNNSRRKRFDLIIRSFALLARQWPHAHLVIKTNRLVSLDGVDLPALVAREHMQEQIEIIVEDLSDQQLVELYHRMDLYLNLSEWEGFCIPVIEAMACGVPVVSLPMQGPGELLPYKETLVPESLIREEDGAILFEAKPSAVCEVLLALVAGGEMLRRRLSQKGRAQSESHYDIRQVVNLWETLL